VGETLFETLRSRLKGKVTADELLCRHTTWRVGGPADLFIEHDDRDELVTVLRMLAGAGVPGSPSAPAEPSATGAFAGRC
jgi:UDP-N-acetylmuramate dehydrogenase